MDKLTDRERILLYILLWVIIISGSFYFLLFPAINSNMEMNSTIEGNRILIQNMQAVKNSIADTEKTAGDLKAKTAALQQGFFSTDVNMEALDVFVTSIALGTGVKPQNLTISGPAMRDSTNVSQTAGDSQDAVSNGITTYTIDINGSTTAAQFAKLTDALGNRSQLFIRNATFTEKEGSGTYSITIDIFLLPSATAIQTVG